MSDLTKAVERVRAARWEAWKQMASKLQDHHVLSIELLRTHDNHTLAVFTVVKDHKPVQYALKGDALGANLKALVTQHCPPIKVGSSQVEALVIGAPASSTGTDDGGVTAESIAMGEPPPKQTPPSAIVSLGASVMTTTFNLGEVAAQAR